jgi:hypothetical protein
LLASATQTATGQSAAFAVPTLTMAMIGVDITAVSSVTDFTCWLEGSDDGGTTWYELVADQVMEHSGAQTENAPDNDQRNIVDSKTATGKHAAVYKHLATDYVRLSWYFAGTSVTFSASLVGK